MRSVLDTNVYVSAFINPLGPPGLILDLWREGRFSLVVSGATLAELRGVSARPGLARHLRRSPSWIGAFLDDLEDAAAPVMPDVVNAVPEDPPDNLILGTASAAAAGYVVSGDRHLLALGSFLGIPILTPRQFLDVLERNG